MLHQNNSFYVRGELCGVQSSVKRPVWAGEAGLGEGNCPTVQSQHFQPHCWKKSTTTKSNHHCASTKLCDFSILSISWKNCTSCTPCTHCCCARWRRQLTGCPSLKISPPLSSCGIFPRERIFCYWLILNKQSLELASLCWCNRHSFGV